ncbi:hypothetical protein TVAG_425940 [Trichomonas vaginalis G3]|uniref:Uncharacterized protein n=1 Tax=Trichomonas vaginalis (strain ATCC PRA-98 / G3) TaxID=412133 RepID=A2FGY2_TRIV3|nr:hypothetical protein TVAGG3_1056180 [Trichomonas vaginalis G3]EAX95841.1 hypothetical protein TVAG_425940 [Trichomonas vaginalis G3]KAI5494462.1 hypothetical protein TVAGG3_1056180 [Trichomonas vaginalis G3]|eukprot:XP_001308771.1 hypothetical protein [Trichomonas vaginalis G3]
MESNHNEQDIYEGLIMAKKLATMIPTSLSIDDLFFDQVKKQVKNNNYMDKNVFIPPSPSVSSIGAVKAETPKRETSKFSFLLSKKSRKVENNASPSKMHYELPNTFKLGTGIAKLRPIYAISFQNLNDDSDKNNNNLPQHIIQGAVQVESDFTDSDD